MKTLLLAVFMCASAAAANAQADAKYLIKLLPPPRPQNASTPPQAGGEPIGLGSDYSDVIKAFGKPKTETTAEGDECRGAKIRTLVYDGLELELSESLEPEKEYYVYSIEITNAKWLPFGIKTGTTQAAIKRKMGSTASQETDSETGERIWYYSFDESDGPGNTNFHFKNGKLVKVFSMYMC